MSFPNRTHTYLTRLLLFTFIATMSASASAEIHWRKSPQSTIESARVSGKPILVFVTTSWCHYCKRMKRETWSDANVDSSVGKQFETLILDGDRDAKIVKQLGLRGYPATLLYSPDGRFVKQRAGFMNAQQTLSWLASAAR